MKYRALLFTMMAACSGNVEIASCKVGDGGSRKQLDRSKLLAAIEGYATKWVGPPRAVRCPEPTHLQWIPGKTFECQIDLAGGTAAITVTMEPDYNAGLSWNEPLMAGAPLEAMLADIAKVKTVDCGDQILFGRPEARITCTIPHGPPHEVRAWLVLGDDNQIVVSGEYDTPPVAQ